MLREPVGAAQDHKDVRPAREREHVRLMRLRHRAVDPRPPELIVADPRLREAGVVQRDPELREMRGYGVDGLQVLRARVQPQHLPIGRQPLQDAEPRRAIGQVTWEPEHPQAREPTRDQALRHPSRIVLTGRRDGDAREAFTMRGQDMGDVPVFRTKRNEHRSARDRPPRTGTRVRVRRRSRRAPEDRLHP